MALSAHFSSSHYHCSESPMEEGTPLQELSTVTPSDINGESSPEFKVSDGRLSSHDKVSQFHQQGASNSMLAAAGKAKSFFLYVAASVRDTTASFANDTMGGGVAADRNLKSNEGQNEPSPMKNETVSTEDTTHRAESRVDISDKESIAVVVDSDDKESIAVVVDSDDKESIAVVVGSDDEENTVAGGRNENVLTHRGLIQNNASEGLGEKKAKPSEQELLMKDEYQRYIEQKRNDEIRNRLFRNFEFGKKARPKQSV